MNYIFFDIECADGGAGAICSFGYVVTDEQFNEIFSRDILINPPGKFRLVGREDRPDVHLAYDEQEFRNSPKFYYYYDEIKALLEGEDKIVIGHSVKNDAEFLNKSCKRYKLPYINFRFVDTQKIFSKVSGNRKQVSLENGLAYFELPMPTVLHKSEEDARATKALMQHFCKLNECETVSDLCNRFEKISGETKEGVALYDGQVAREGRKHHVKTGGQRYRVLKEEYKNFILQGSINKLLFTRMMDFAEQKQEVPQALNGKKVCVSLNYEMYHFKEMIHLVQMVADAGGTYVLKASQADLFATIDGVMDADGNIRDCTRLKYVLESNANGGTTEIITLDELLSLLGTTRDELEASEPINVEYLMDEQYSKRIMVS